LESFDSPIMYEEIVRRREGGICHLGPMVVRTGYHTGPSPDDKFIVKEPTSSSQISWDTVDQPFNPGEFDGLYNRMLGYFHGRDIFVQDCYEGASPHHRVPIRIITEEASTICLPGTCSYKLMKPKSWHPIDWNSQSFALQSSMPRHTWMAQ